MERDVEQDVFEVATTFGDGTQHAGKRGLPTPCFRQFRGWLSRRVACPVAGLVAVIR